MNSITATPGYGNERQLWLLSLAMACVMVAIMLWIVGICLRNTHLTTTPRALPIRDDSMVIAIAPLPPTPAPTTPAEPDKKAPKRFARTSPDQATSTPPANPDFIGDRDTIATSDTLPADGAPAMPSQAGRDPRRPDDIETTESVVQDGSLEHDQIASPSTTPATSTARPTEQVAEVMKNPPAPSPPDAIKEPTPPQDSPSEITETAAKKIPATDVPTLPGDQNVERPMTEEGLKPQKAENPPDVANTPPEPPTESLLKPTPPAKPQTPKEPGFRGNQSKTKITGSIKRQGRSALNVANTAMGRYHSILSRAVEAEWHRNCAKYRDFITPGILTIRFVIDPNGSVRSVNVVEMIDAGEVQKGFTLNSIRQAKIPPIPADLKAELEDDPIEITYNFYF